MDEYIVRVKFPIGHIDSWFVKKREAQEYVNRFCLTGNARDMEWIGNTIELIYQRAR